MQRVAYTQSMRRLGFQLALWLAVAISTSISHAQVPEKPTSQPTTSPTTVPTTAPTTAPVIALAEINGQMDAAAAVVRGIQANLTPESLHPPIADDLPQIKAEIEARIEEDRLTIYSHPSVDSLRSLTETWQEWNSKLADAKRDLTMRATRLDQNVQTLADLAKVWWDRTSQARESDAPAEVVQRAQALLEKIYTVRGDAEKGRTLIIAKQNLAAEQLTRAGEMLAAIKSARDTVVGRLLTKDAEPIWTAVANNQSPQAVITASQTSLSNQLIALKTYARGWRQIFLAHALVTLLIIAFLFAVRRRVEAWTTAEPDLKGAFDVFYFPVSTGLVLSVVASIWIYTQAPHLMWVILGTAMVIPSIYLLRQLLDRRYHSALTGLAVFYAWDQLRNVVASQALPARLLFLVEMIGGVLFVLWLMRGGKVKDIATGLDRRLATGLTLLLRIAGVLFVIALIADSAGYVGLGRLIGSGTLISGYLGMIFYTAAEILDGLIMSALRLWPLNLLNLVQHHRELVYHRLSRVMRGGVVLFWLWMVLDLFSIRGPVISRAWQWLTATLSVGPLQLSLWNLFSFGLVIWISFTLSRFIRFLLDEDVYPRLDLPRGLPNAFSTALHYILLLIGFFTAVGALGYDLSKFTILAGAFGVGLGFGLQNIVNNFVSGIILLFERPIKIGDTIEIDGQTGVVGRIGIRASVIRTTLGSELIVPNGRFISEKVTNWTFSTGQRAIQVSVSVVPGTDPQEVISLLLKTARENELVADDPLPQAILSGFNAGGMTFDLQAWTKRYEDWTIARSQLGMKVVEALKAAGIPLK